jgi:hypothetical protein
LDAASSSQDHLPFQQLQQLQLGPVFRHLPNKVVETFAYDELQMFQAKPQHNYGFQATF